MKYYCINVLIFVKTKNGVLGGIRTPDRRLRRPLLYPAELPGHQQKYYNKKLIKVKVILKKKQTVLSKRDNVLNIQT